MQQLWLAPEAVSAQFHALYVDVPEGQTPEVHVPPLFSQSADCCVNTPNLPKNTTLKTTSTKSAIAATTIVLIEIPCPFMETTSL
jgi:hypothetical protein